MGNRCEPGLVPKPDTITGCGPECVHDPDCQTGFVCQNQRCIEKPDPCNPSPCGPGATCMVNNLGNPICRLIIQIILNLYYYKCMDFPAVQNNCKQLISGKDEVRCAELTI